MKLRAKKGEGAATLEELAEFSRGLICLTRHPDERLLDIFGRAHLYAELQRHLQPRGRSAQPGDDRARAPPAASRWSPPTASPTPRPRSANCSTSSPASAIKSRWPTAGRLLERNAERHLKPPAEMARLFADLPEAIANTRELSARLEFTLADLGYEFPRYPVPEGETQMSLPAQAAPTKARAAATGPITSARAGRSSASWR